ncbi:methylmalonyl Co-A mutase-associated GTPase MeaB [Phosphitispora fastidiosa]|uniref:methylmalonyl Co-A mutase-associated GTPase MeaB n=1 Tax=Phosphitispora fastidiosa TaxID=2837202 RepID=UPI001E3A5BC3|nr:methylmalonyl Co-A mutase-associated GTPase MeaB [Phosphitispora fastidiosa]MBU7007611.1 LAO/AO transport system kinase [Phosphitispora fastidiosa]
MEEMLKKVISGDRRTVARAITMVENRDPRRYKMLAGLRSRVSHALVVGITGPPGAGKSALADRLITEYRRKGLTVGIIAVDPSSPFTGGALLGDRIRMQQHATDSGVFIRSMGTRGSLGGLSLATGEAAQILAASGKDIILIETVGVGQSEMEIMKIADTTIVVLTPGGGDSIQTIKAGIMEIADVFALNKADLPGARRMAREVRIMVETNCHGAPWCPPVVETVTINGQGVSELAQAVKNHCQYLSESGKLEEKRQQRVLDELSETIISLFGEWLGRQGQQQGLLTNAAHRVASGQADPYGAAVAMLQGIFAGGFKEEIYSFGCQDVL